MAAIVAGAERRNLPQAGKRRRQSRQCFQETVALFGAELINHTHQIAQRILHQHPLPDLCQVEAHAAPIPVRAPSGNQAPAFQRFDDLRGRPPRRRLETGEIRWRARVAVGPREEPQAGPLRRRQFRASVLAARSAAHMDQQFSDSIRRLVFIDHSQLVSNRNHFDNTGPI